MIQGYVDIILDALKNSSSGDPHARRYYPNVSGVVRIAGDEFTTKMIIYNYITKILDFNERILTGATAGDKVLIPKLTIIPSDLRVPLKFQRKLFSVMVSYAMTINKSQCLNFPIPARLVTSQPLNLAAGKAPFFFRTRLKNKRKSQFGPGRATPSNTRSWRVEIPRLSHVSLRPTSPPSLSSTCFEIPSHRQFAGGAETLMSIVQKETIEVIAQSVGISNLSPDVLPALAADVEYRVREIMQEAIKCMRHSRRTTLTTDDVDSALSLRNVEPIYGFASGDPLRFRRAAGHKDLFYVEEKDVEFKEVIEAPLPKAPLDTAVIAHWLAVEGVQPAIPENPPPEALQTLSLPSDNRKTEVKEEGVHIDVKLPIKHVLSRELQLYFEKITELTVSRSESPLFKEALVSLATDSGIHPLVPYFTYFIADELHQLMPPVMTCLVARRLGHKNSDSHWDLRNFSANLVSSICKRFGHVYHDLPKRVTNTLLHAFLDPSKALPQHYGAIQGLAAMGPNVVLTASLFSPFLYLCVRKLVLPNLEPYLCLLAPEMQLETQKNEMKRHEAWLVYGALVRAAGLCLHDRMKRLPSLPSPSAHTVLKSNNKVLTTVSNKRKASMDNVMHQPPLKKLVTDNSAGNSLQMDSGHSNVQQSVPYTNNNNIVGSSSGGKEIISEQGLKVVDQAWKDDVDGQQLLLLLYEYFGESMLSFVPSPEASLFL
ncbi:transcription initiation factor TFIID subunit 6 [Striga asiatica]|uniref:Transcription initiation factor TFIID subunit 6 n=1 Tax=Striga asiatica TaxID=4170 RepID=A0A5A7PJQ4_STRAF|nr:transcription initiation factor TFIID subunit 6 [Striga asiatica]